VKPERLGSALAIRSLLGFGAGAIAPLVFGWVLDLYGGTPRPSPDGDGPSRCWEWEACSACSPYSGFARCPRRPDWREASARI
jgi:MFS family permease